MNLLTVEAVLPNAFTKRMIYTKQGSNQQKCMQNHPSTRNHTLIGHTMYSLLVQKYSCRISPQLGTTLLGQTKQFACLQFGSIFMQNNLSTRNHPLSPYIQSSLLVLNCHGNPIFSVPKYMKTLKLASGYQLAHLNLQQQQRYCQSDSSLINYHYQQNSYIVQGNYCFISITA